MMNGDWSFMGIDSDNENKPWWAHSIYWAIIDWGAIWWWLFGFDYYNTFIMIDWNTTSVLAYCDLTNTDPFNCDGNWVTVDTGTNDPNYIIEEYSYFTVE